MARLIWTLGAMAAERVFYGENSTGVGGDVQSATARSAWMVGACAMAPERIEFGVRGFLKVIVAHEADAYVVPVGLAADVGPLVAERATLVYSSVVIDDVVIADVGPVVGAAHVALLHEAQFAGHFRDRRFAGSTAQDRRRE